MRQPLLKSCPVSQVHTADLMLLCIDTASPHSFIKYRVPYRISVIVDVDLLLNILQMLLQIWNTLIRSKAASELMLPTSRSTLDKPAILDVLEVEIPQLLEHGALDGNSLSVDKLTSHQ